MDSNKIAQIADVMEDRGLTRVRVEEPDGSAFELERAVEQAPVPAVVVPQVVAADAAVAAPIATLAAAPAPPAAPAAPAAPASSAEAGEAAAPQEPEAHEVKAPMVGVYYAAPAPGAEPFVRVGSKVKKGETLCIIEAMKVMNEVAAEADGEVLSIDASDGELVEYGGRLMTIG
ncbi:MAG: acetyl-CoA carboxylase biotin carboxyl carrier protein [Coriobacteriia bacterium]|nr:acetyl-CoA carboxylase biotin carboxyl carrier protein [Coriobacteriia bacterium]